MEAAMEKQKFDEKKDVEILETGRPGLLKFQNYPGKSIFQKTALLAFINNRGNF